MHLKDETDFYYDQLNKNWEIGVAKSNESIFDQISVVNGISTHRGGTHINKISMELSKIVYEQLAKKYKKLKFTWNNVKSNLFLFVIVKVPNPTFDTQTKEYLTTTITKEILDLEFKDQFIKKIVKSDICQTIIDWIEARELQELNRQSKKLKKIKVAKLIDAKSTKNTNKELFIFEGLSALSSFRKFRDPQTQGAFPLKGKFINVSEIKATKVIENEEAKNLIASIGLHIGQEVNEEELRYKKIYITADADVDGDAISALLINFFYKFWPELFKQKRIYKVYTPLMVAKSGRKVKYFYNEQDFETWAEKIDLSKWSLEYKKGLASLEDVEYKDMIRNPHVVEIKIDESTKENLLCWFGNNSKLRKEKLLS
jgi:DNA topoisomerase-2